MSISSADIRNIAVIGHSGEGKTSVCEAILFNGKSTDRLGKVTEGNTVTDYDEQEIARKMSISLALAYTVYEGVKINLLDVPGFYDFEGEENEALARRRRCADRDLRDGSVSVGAEKAIEKCLAREKADGPVYQRHGQENAITKAPSPPCRKNTRARSPLSRSR